jgi:hypothetical protein
MKNGRFNSLTALATELERRAEAKRDYVADTRHVVAEVSEDKVKLAVGDEQFDINDLAHRQIGEATNVPAVYYDKMRKDAPDLLAANVNRWLRQEPAKKTIRILDGNVPPAVFQSAVLQMAEAVQAALDQPPTVDLVGEPVNTLAI